MSPFELRLVVKINIYFDYKRVFTRVGSDVCDRVGHRPFLPTDAGCTGMHTDKRELQ